MSGPNTLLDKGYQLAASQYPRIFRVVKISGTGAAGTQPLIAVSSSAGEKVLGVVQEDTPPPNDPLAGGKDYAALGRVVNVRIAGITRVVATGVIAVGSRVKSNGDGTVVIAAASTANQEIVGVALSASAATNDQIDLLLTPGMQSNNP
jgi:hypothetical protein